MDGVPEAIGNEKVREASVLTVSGGHGGGETPGPIPNPEVKPSSADGTALETGWESRSPPDIFEEGPRTRALLRLSGKVRLCRGREPTPVVGGGRARSGTTDHLANGLPAGSPRRSERRLEPERPTGPFAPSRRPSVTSN